MFFNLSIKNVILRSPLRQMAVPRYEPKKGSTSEEME
jgi:hypothetical protein